MLYLATASGRAVRDAMAASQLGQMLTYKSGNLPMKRSDGTAVPFAIDNGCVSIVDGRPVNDPNWSETRWLRMLDRYQDTPGCLFAVVPDWVCDAERTNERWTRYAPLVHARGYRAAYVTQNGCTAIPPDADAVFVGGDDDWKDGLTALALTNSARARGLWCHLGRANTWTRIHRSHLDGYDSVDGTTLAFGPDQNLPQLLRWLHRINTQPALFGGAA